MSGYSVRSRKVSGKRIRFCVICTDPKGGEWIVSDFTWSKSAAQRWCDRLTELDRRGEHAGRLTA